MLCRALLLLLLACLAAPAAAAARPPARAVLEDCVRSLDESERAGVFVGEMRALPGAARMQMRFKLQARTPERTRWTSVQAPGFGAWVSSVAGTARYVYTKRVENLLAPASYRVQVRFRWLDAAGGTVESARAYSRICRQPDPRPNLVVRSIGVEMAFDPSRRRYVVAVDNTGRSEAEASTLALSVGGQALLLAPVGALAADEDTLVTLEGPACTPGAPLFSDADVDEAVEEREEGDNRFSRLCPAPAA